MVCSKLARGAAAGGCLLALVGTARAAGSCPEGLDPFSEEPNPFGWPLTPAEFTYDRQDCWLEHYPRCAGARQSPMLLDAEVQGFGCGVRVQGEAGNLVQRANYKIIAGRPGVSVSTYMRGVSLRGALGSLTLQDAQGRPVEYEAVEALLLHGGLHNVGGETEAELLIVHKPKASEDAYHGRLVVSVPFRKADGGHSDLFDQLGLVSASVAPESETWRAPKSVDLAAATRVALEGTSLSYDGSIPAPPCTENVRYIVLTNSVEVGPEQLDSLETVIRRFAGGVEKREPVSRKNADGVCRAVDENSIQAPAAVTLAKTPCSRWPAMVLANETDRSKAPQAAASMIDYRPTRNVEVSPSEHSLDAVGDFGGLLVNGRLFRAGKVSIQAVGQHSFNGTRHAAELVIEHLLYGDYLLGAGEAEVPAADAAAAAHTAHRRLEEETVGGTVVEGAAVEELPADAGHGEDAAVHDEATATHVETSSDNAPHEEAPADGAHGDAAQPPKAHVVRRVMVSVPLKLGRESPLLRSLGLGFEANNDAIRHENSYRVTEPVDLKAGLNASTSKGWYWYSGSEPIEGCPMESVKWMVFEEPLEVSVKQLNALALKVSGFDLVAPPQIVDQSMLSRSFVPYGGLEDGDCDETNLYRTSCWAAQDLVCRDGEAQSPINVLTAAPEKVSNHSYLAKVSWKPVLGESIENDGYGLSVKTNQMGYSTVIGPNGFPKFYQVTDVVLRMPSEHLLDGRQFPAELQVVQKNQKTVLEYDDEDAIISSFFFDFGKESKLLKQLLPTDLPQVGESKVIQRPLDLQWALGPALDGPFYSYRGSYTTPGCQESVMWTIFGTNMSMSREQFMAFRAVFPEGTSRPVQALNDRRLLKNTLDEPEAVDYKFFLNREMGRDKRETPVGYIAFPIVGTAVLMTVVMAAVFQREDSARKSTSAGGLEGEARTLGKAYDKL